MIGTVFCNFVANAMYQPACKAQFRAYYLAVSNATCMCVTHSVIDVQVELQNASFKQGSASQQTIQNPSHIVFSASGLEVCCICMILFHQ